MSRDRNNPIRVKAFQHSPSEPLGYFEQIFSEKEIPFTYARLWEGEPVCMGDATHLVFLGGPMSVNDEKELLWLKEEKELIHRAVKKRVSVLGLCLGAQLIASAHEATVYRFVNETGWYPVHTTPDSTGVFASFSDTFHVFQMHGKTFHLPLRGKLQCRGDQVPHQGFRLGSALGLQFHLEMTESLIKEWTMGERKYLKAKIGRDTERYLAESNRLCRQVAREFLSRKPRHMR
ncbi:MAG: type 1 glutamine amidotransferase [Methanoregula sp.]|jgi:GMP synthase-like glutamine amidotransferase